MVPIHTVQGGGWKRSCCSVCSEVCNTWRCDGSSKDRMNRGGEHVYTLLSRCCDWG